MDKVRAILKIMRYVDHYEKVIFSSTYKNVKSKRNRKDKRTAKSRKAIERQGIKREELEKLKVEQTKFARKIIRKTEKMNINKLNKIIADLVFK